MLASTAYLSHARRSWLFAYVVASERVQRVARDHSGEAILAEYWHISLIGLELVGCQVSGRFHSIPGGLDGQDVSAWQITIAV
jgi:hypothetical protein